MTYAPETLAIRAGHQRSSEREHSEGIFLTSSYVFDSAEMAAQMFSGEVPGNSYSRFSNTTVDIFEQRLCALEGGERCLATASGMAAIYMTLMGLLKSGDHIVAARALFGSTFSLLNNYLPRFGIQTTFVDPENPEDFRAAMQSNTKIIFLETPSNPLMQMTDIQKVSDIAHEYGALCVVDNCFATPVLQRPLALGADIVVHSATKYIDGQGRCLGGAIIGDHKTVGETIYFFARTVGASLSPFNAWVLLKGLETLSLRMKAHSQNATALAKWLSAQANVQQVFYPGLETHPQYTLAKAQMDGFGGMVSFEVAGGREGAWRVIDQCRLLSVTGNLGDVKTTITHPATTTHMRLTEEERLSIGITQGLIRLSVGLEDIQDIQNDLHIK